MALDLDPQGHFVQTLAGAARGQIAAARDEVQRGHWMGFTVAVLMGSQQRHLDVEKIIGEKWSGQ